MILPLSHIPPGTSAQIVFLGNDAQMAGRLRDLGFTPGAVISCVLQKTRRNIAAYLVRGAVIALREEDSRLVFVRCCNQEPATPKSCFDYGISNTDSSTNPENMNDCEVMV